MPRFGWEWWVKSDAGLAARLAIGLSIFAALAIADLRRHGRAARRWREYAFLALAALAAMAYGVVNDQITCAISWEYFYYGKGLARSLGPRTPPDPVALHRAVAALAVQATWYAGLIAGVALLLANNPRKDRPQLPYRRLVGHLLSVMLFAAAGGAALGLAGYAGWLTWTSDDFRWLVREDVFRPRRFLCTYGIHLGGYVGGLVGTVWAAWRVGAERRGRPSSDRR